MVYRIFIQETSSPHTKGEFEIMAINLDVYLLAFPCVDSAEVQVE